MKDKLATAPAALASHATRKLEKLINKGSSSSSAIPLSKRRTANQLTSQLGRRSSRRRGRRRRRRRAQAARLGLARAIGLNSSIGML